MTDFENSWFHNPRKNNESRQQMATQIFKWSLWGNFVTDRPGCQLLHPQLSLNFLRVWQVAITQSLMWCNRKCPTRPVKCPTQPIMYTCYRKKKKHRKQKHRKKNIEKCLDEYDRVSQGGATSKNGRVRLSENSLLCKSKNDQNPLFQNSAN